MSSKAYKNLGEILIEMGALRPDALQRALRIQSRRLGQILIDEQLADAAVVAQALKLQASSSDTGTVAALRIPSALVHGLLGDLDGVLSSLSADESCARDKVLEIKRQFSSLLVAPASSLFSRAREVLAESLSEEGQGKAATLETTGGEFSLDQTLVSEVADMLVHLVRNAVHHGIEPQEERRAIGKPAVGCVSVDLSLEAAGLVLRLTDDGRGIDVPAIEHKAREMGLSGSWKQVLFTPGFSTRERASLHAGRGIGLDVVESAVLRLKGSLDMDTTAGNGTAFTIKVPLTFASVPALAARYGEQWLLFHKSRVSQVAQTAGTCELRELSQLFQADPTLPPVVNWVIDADGGAWGVHEVQGIRDVFVSGVAPFLGERYAIIGTGHIDDIDREALLVDLRGISEIKRP